jgi:hypothetical protein
MEEYAELGKGGTDVEGFVQDRGQSEAAGCYTPSRRHVAEDAILEDYNRFGEEENYMINISILRRLPSERCLQFQMSC